MPKIMKYDIPPAREARLRMPPGCKVLGATVLQVMTEQAVMTPSGTPRFEMQQAANLALVVEYPDLELEKIPRRILVVPVGESKPADADDFDNVGVVAMGPVAVVLYLERESKIMLVSP